MLINKKRSFFLVLFLFGLQAYSQNIDSLQKVYNTTPYDTLKAKILVDMTDILYFSKPDTVIPLCELSLKIINNKYASANAAEKRSFLNTKAAAFNNIGYIHKNLGNIPKALEFYCRSLKIHEEIGDKKGLSTSLNNIGLIYGNYGDIKKGLEYYQKALKIREEINDRSGIANSLNNIASTYKELGDTSKALEYYNKSIPLEEEINDKDGLAWTMDNIGLTYSAKGNYSRSIEYFKKSLAFSKEIGNKREMTYSLNYIAQDLLKQDRPAEALSYAEQSLQLSKELGYPEVIRNGSRTLSKIYSKTGNWKGAFEMQVLMKKMDDSIFNENTHKTAIQKALQYEYDKKTIADSIKTLGERKVFAAEIKQEKTTRYGLYIGLILITIFSLFIYNRFRITRKQKGIIEAQKIEVDHQRELADSRRIIAEEQRFVIQEKQKEILDSIQYASRIQKAMLTSEEYITKHLKAEYFIFYKPKDIVSGDFYWAVHHHDKFYMATSDCTGHGVPGAFMSLLNISFLTENVIEREIKEPAKILDEQRKEIIKALNPTGNENSKDGMDCTLCAFDFTNNKLEFAAANNPLWLIRNKELIEYKGDKMPVGKGEDLPDDFTAQVIDLQKGDLIYTFTDGFADQFGGPKGKKFMYKQLGQLLLDNHHLTMSEQQEALLRAMNEWKGKLEQVDDILVIGVKI